MKSLRFSLALVATFTFVLFAAVTLAQTPEVTAERTDYVDALKTALAAGNYLDAYSEVVMLNDSAPAERNTLLESKANADAPARIFVMLFSYQVDQAVTAAEALPDGEFVNVVKASADSMLGHADDSAAALALALKGTSSPAQIYGLMAAAAFTMGSPDDLLKYSEQAIALDARLAAAYRLRGVGKLRSGDPQAAIADADRAIALEPDTYYFHVLTANAHLALGDGKAALADLDAVLALNSHSFLGHAARVGADMMLGDPAQAGKDFASAIEARTSDLVEGPVLTADQPFAATMSFGTTFHLPVTAQAGQTLTVDVTSVTPNQVDSSVLLLDPDGVPLAFNDDAGDETLDAQIDGYAVVKSGTYIVVVSHANAGSEGDIKVLLSLDAK